eukprot:CAMPEP_0167754868 /NCGR_PEP_ID=MMETSP0110_2-20121227/8509_1 /TAXON_ID=629695 /ORGANISM="Gymnochlora sp., Strain CCMP2014" /LENGTH=231 /DNA_ID=CAMNT_0007640795 /DNA_START=1095 /DNA_END=1791 /DNA_ORIENTATION=-
MGEKALRSESSASASSALTSEVGKVSLGSGENVELQLGEIIEAFGMDSNQTATNSQEPSFNQLRRVTKITHTDGPTVERDQTDAFGMKYYDWAVKQMRVENSRQCSQQWLVKRICREKDIEKMEALFMLYWESGFQVPHWIIEMLIIKCEIMDDKPKKDYWIDFSRKNKKSFNNTRLAKKDIRRFATKLFQRKPYIDNWHRAKMLKESQKLLKYVKTHDEPRFRVEEEKRD